MSTSDKLKRVFESFADRLDERLLGAVYAAVSVPVSHYREVLRQSGHAFVDPRRLDLPGFGELERTADWVVQQYSYGQATLSGVAAVGGIASVPPEVAATLLHAVRLAQRLAVVYGFDPDSDVGRMAMWQALAAAFEVELPPSGPMGLRVSELASLSGRAVSPEDISAESVAGQLVRRAVRRTALRIGTRFSRWIPVLGAGVSLHRARENATEMGRRMVHVYVRLTEDPLAWGGRIEEAKEITLRSE